MRTLLIGASGQLGRALQAEFSHGYEVVPAGHRHIQPGWLALDLGNAEEVRTVLGEVRPTLILIAGAMCAVDRCEMEVEACRRVNVLGPGEVADYARRHGARLVYFSSDHVFDGAQDGYREDDAVSPLNVYARSKADGEAVLRDLAPACHLILRTSWVYGPDAQRRNFALRAVDQMAAGRTVTVPADQWGSPTYTEDLASATRFLLEHDGAGTFHATGPDFLSRAALAQKICARFGFASELIASRPTSELGQPARRPLQPRLNCSKFRACGAPDFRGVDRGLEALRASKSSLVRQP